MGNIGNELGLNVIHLFKEAYDLTDPEVVAQVRYYIKQSPGVSLWGSLPCTTWSSWQYMAIQKYGPKYLRKLQGRRCASLALFTAFVELAALVVEGGGEVSFEWPRHCIGCAQVPVSRFIANFGLHEGLCDGCTFGMTDSDGYPVLKPWGMVTTSKSLAWNLSQCHCFMAQISTTPC